MTPAAVLRAAAALIEERGWCQGQSYGDHGEVCALGAIWEVDQMRTEGLKARRRLALWLVRKQRFKPTDTFDYVAQWNDDPSRTQSQVIAALRQAAGDE